MLTRPSLVRNSLESPINILEAISKDSDLLSSVRLDREPTFQQHHGVAAHNSPLDRSSETLQIFMVMHALSRASGHFVSACRAQFVFTSFDRLIVVVVFLVPLKSRQDEVVFDGMFAKNFTY